MNELREMIARLEQEVGIKQPEDDGSIADQVALQDDQINHLQNAQTDWVKDIEV